MQYLLLAFFLLFSIFSFSQKMSLSGNVQDTVVNAPLSKATAMVVRLADSVLVDFTRTDENGNFSFKNLMIDTVQVILSHPNFGDQTFYVFASADNYEFDFGRVTLPPKSVNLNEFVIYAYKEPVYYSGDTLIYNADSFKVRPNANVEELLRKLPGLDVDAQGKITSQGQKIDKVLVDGDEFFGTDPTIATRNLNATALESVQLYEKKNEEATSDGDDETIKVLDLKLKEEAKKGYFGKISGATDAKKFYEGEVLANKFKNKQKIAVFMLTSNTPKSSLGWEDAFKYGLNNGLHSYNEDEDTYYSTGNNDNTGIPQTLKSGFYYNDNLGEKTKISLSYNYNNNHLNVKTDKRLNYFLQDTTYLQDVGGKSLQKNETHFLKLNITHKLDSLTEIEFTSSVNYGQNSENSYESNGFLTSSEIPTRTTSIENNNDGKNYDVLGRIKLERKFKKENRKLELSYQLKLQNIQSEGILKSTDIILTNDFVPINATDQQKKNSSDEQHHYASIEYTEPLSKKIRVAITYDYDVTLGTQDKNTFDYFNGNYMAKNLNFSNNFESIKQSNRLGLKFIYEVKKQRLTIGSRLRNIQLNNLNLISNQTVLQNVTNFLPYMRYTYRIADNSRLNFKYITTSILPTINQLQPIPDNSNPNLIKIGNQNLKPGFKQRFSLDYNSWSVISGRYVYGSVSFNTTSSDFTNSTVYDSIGRAVVQTININGNYNANAYLGTSYPFFNKRVEINPMYSSSLSSNSNLINNQKNITKNSSHTGELNIDIKFKKIEFEFGGEYTYNLPNSTLNNRNNSPYYTQEYRAATSLLLPFKFSFRTDAKYTINSKRAGNYNINYLIWNAALDKLLLKNENLILSFEATDILNQNINANRTVTDNVITDSKTTIISRFFLLRLTYKFNNNNTKETDDDWD